MANHYEKLNLYTPTTLCTSFLHSDSSYLFTINTGIIYTQFCSGDDNNCVNIKLNPFYFDQVLGEHQVYIKKSSEGDAFEYYEELSLQPGEVRQLCEIESGIYTITVYTGEDCKEDFSMRVGNDSIERFTLSTIKTGCTLEALHIDNPPTYAQADWIYSTSEVTSLLSINNGEDFRPNPLKWAPGLYRVVFSDGCNGFKVGSAEVECQVEGDGRLSDAKLPTSGSSQDGSLWIRNINICTATNGEISMHLMSSAGQISTPNSWSTFSGLGSDLYTLVVEDEFGCSADVETFDFRVNDSDVDVEIEVSDACYNTDNGSVEIWVGSEYQNYTYSTNIPNLTLENSFESTFYRAENLSSTVNYEFTITTNEGCVFTYPITISERAENQFWRGSVRTDVTHGYNSGALGSVNLHLGSIPLPATVSWDGEAPQTINSSSVSKTQLSSGEHSVEIISYCGVTTSGRA